VDALARVLKKNEAVFDKFGELQYQLNRNEEWFWTLIAGMRVGNNPVLVTWPPFRSIHKVRNSTCPCFPMRGRYIVLPLLKNGLITQRPFCGARAVMGRRGEIWEFPHPPEQKAAAAYRSTMLGTSLMDKKWGGNFEKNPPQRQFAKTQPKICCGGVWCGCETHTPGFISPQVRGERAHPPKILSKKYAPTGFLYLLFLCPFLQSSGKCVTQMQKRILPPHIVGNWYTFVRKGGDHTHDCAVLWLVEKNTNLSFAEKKNNRVPKNDPVGRQRERDRERERVLGHSFFFHSTTWGLSNYLLNWSISLSRGNESNFDSYSNGEWIRKPLLPKYGRPHDGSDDIGRKSLDISLGARTCPPIICVVWEKKKTNVGPPKIYTHCVVFLMPLENPKRWKKRLCFQP